MSAATMTTMLTTYFHLCHYDQHDFLEEAWSWRRCRPHHSYHYPYSSYSSDGRSQCPYTSKIETSSPTASQAEIFLTCMIDAYEKRDVATQDIADAFLQTKMPNDEKDVHVMLVGRMAELLAKISPETYQKYIHHRRGQSYIYCKVNVAIYGTLKVALLFWK